MEEMVVWRRGRGNGPAMGNVNMVFVLVGLRFGGLSVEARGWVVGREVCCATLGRAVLPSLYCLKEKVGFAERLGLVPLGWGVGNKMALV